MRNDPFQITDALYGDVRFAPPIADLARRPLMQRLRQVRLSNIDSLDMPGIANISRFEHSLGAAYLASKVGFSSGLDERETLILQAAALIHDTAITPFGHLVEEALQYVKADFNHEVKWSVLLSDSTRLNELGGIDTQIFMGRSSGLREWAAKIFGGNGPRFLGVILDAIQGRGKFGQCIASDLDLDNLDNLTRIAFHMGLRPDPELPIRLSESMSVVEEDGEVSFEQSAIDDIKAWSRLRHSVYEHLMPAPADFCGKLMLLSSTVEAFRNGVLDRTTSWMLTDSDFVHRLRHSDLANIRETVERWLIADLWESTELMWFRGPVPSLPEILSFVEQISRTLGRQCFGYRIKDKRNRQINVRLTSGSRVKLGQNSDSWLFGVASPVRKPFVSEDLRKISRLVEEAFGATGAPASRVEAALFE
jgi:HD superfamily phosphohydrolase